MTPNTQYQEQDIYTEVDVYTEVEKAVTELEIADGVKTLDFSTLGLPENLLHSLQRMNFTTPTPIQAAAIPLALQGRDILGSAQTGTGKTGAFCIPMVAKLLADPKATALVMTPTRELASQVLAAIEQMIPTQTIKTALLIGGEPIPKQFGQLKMRPRIIVGTPGRINDHILRGTVNLSQTRFLVLDETDRMLDMGFGIQIDKILESVPQERQTLLFSATLPGSIVKLSSRYMRNPERIAVGSTTSPVANIKQEVIHTPEAQKYDHLLQQLDQRTGSVIVFVKTKHGADRLADKLCREEHRADAIHGDLQQRKRDRVIQNFRDKKNRILVATDVAARGLDIPHIEHVINYDLPQVPEDYIHRIGRTARAGAEGSAVNMITPSDGAKWKAIQRLINPGQGQSNDKDDFFREGGNKSRGGNKSFGAKKPWQKDRPSFGGSDSRGGDRGFGAARPRFNDERPRFNNDERRAERPRFNDESRSERPRFNNDAPRTERPRFNDERPRSDDRFGSRSNDTRRAPSDRPQESRGRYNDERPQQSYRREDDNPFRRPAAVDRFARPAPRSDDRFGDKPASRGPRPFGDKPFGAKPFGAKPGAKAGPKPFGAKPGASRSGPGAFAGKAPVKAGGFKKRFAGGGGNSW